MSPPLKKRKVQSGGQGRSEAGPGEWKTLCSDIHPLILEKLRVHELARAAPTCRYFHTFYLRHVAEERAALIAAGVEAYGEGVFSVFVAALQRARSLSYPCPSLGRKGSEALWGTHMVVHRGLGSRVFYGTTNDILIANCRIPKYATTEDVRKKMSADEPLAIIRKHVSEGFVFIAELQHRRLGNCMQIIPPTPWCIFDAGKGTLRLKVDVNAQAAAATLGILLAFCQGKPKAASRRSPCLTIDVRIWGKFGGAAGVREADYLVAPLRSLAESITIHQVFKMDSPVVDDRKADYRPLGNFNVVMI